MAKSRWLGIVFIWALVAQAAFAQTITNVSVVKNAGNTGDYLNVWPSNTHGQTASTVQLTSAGATAFSTRYAALVTADSELFGLSAHLVLNSDYTITFTVNAPGGYRVRVQTRRKGEMTLHEDNIFVADHFADVTALTGSFTGGTLVSGSLDFVDPGKAMDIPLVFDPIFVAFDQAKTAVIDGTSNGVNVVHTLTFTWSQDAFSPAAGDEAAVRLGATSLDPDETAGNYPGSPARTQTDDGHFVTVTVEPLCGDGVVGAGESCDQGAANGTPTSCCTATCTARAAGATCRAIAGPCDVPEQCDGVDGACPANVFSAGGTVCRAASAGMDCDETEVCSGSGAACPADAVFAAGTPCRAAADLCDVGEQCDGANKLCPGDGVAPGGTVCRAGGDECDPAEQCDGASIVCPADQTAADGTACADDGAFCSGAETCQGGACTSAGDPCETGYCDEPSDQCVAAGCDYGPLAGCRSADKTIFLYKDKANDSADKLIVRWIKAQSADQAALADPRTSAAYDLCVYAGASEALLLQATVPPDAQKWDTLGSSGYSYKDGEGAADGAQRLLLKGSDGNRTKILWKGRGADLPELNGGSLPLGSEDFPLLVQFMNSANGTCFETSFAPQDVLSNGAGQLKLKSP